MAGPTDAPDATDRAAELPPQAVPPAPSRWRRACRWVAARPWWVTPTAVSQSLCTAVNRLGWLAGLAVVLWVSQQLVSYRMLGIQEVDSQGYFEMAKSFARLTWPQWPDEYSRFTGHVWVDPRERAGSGRPLAKAGEGQPRYVPPAVAPSSTVPSLVSEPLPPVAAKYSPGWPLLLAVGYWLGGAAGALWVNPLLAMLGALLFFLLAERLAGAVLAAICTFVWVTSPMFVMYTDYPLGHGPEVTCTLLAFYALLHWARRGQARWALLAGLAGAYLPTIRPTCVLMWPAMVVLYFTLRAEAQAVRLRAPERSWAQWRAAAVGGLRALAPGALWRALLGPAARPWLAAALGAALPLTALAAYNWHQFGHLTRTGYYFTGEQQAFDLRWLWAEADRVVSSTWHGAVTTQWVTWRWQQVWADRGLVLEEYAVWLCVAGLLLGWRSPGRVLSATLWLVPTLILYVSYYFFWSGPVFYRFIFSAVPGVIFSIGYLGCGWVRRAPLVQLVMLLAFGWWMWQAPPRYFLRRAQVARGEHRDPRLFPWGSPQARDALTQGFAQGQIPHRTADLEQWVYRQPCVVYAPANHQWEVAIYPTVIACDLEAWHNQSWAAGGAPGQVWGDPVRAERIKAQVQALGPEHLPDLLRAQITAHLEAQRRVFLLLDLTPRQDRNGRVLTDDPYPELAWARATPAWVVKQVYTRPEQPATPLPTSLAPSVPPSSLTGAPAAKLPTVAPTAGLPTVQLWEIQLGDALLRPHAALPPASLAP